MIKGLENTLFDLLGQENYSVLEHEKLKFGIQIILTEFYKLIFIYLIAFLLDCIVPTVIIHLVFFLLRQVCLGYHFNNLYICLVWSAIVFPFAAKYLDDLDKYIPTLFLYMGTILLSFLVFTLAPRGTENQPIINHNHRSYLRKKMNIRLLLIIGVFLFIPLKFKVFITYGVLVETIMLIIQIAKERFSNEQRKEMV